MVARFPNASPMRMICHCAAIAGPLERNWHCIVRLFVHEHVANSPRYRVRRVEGMPPG